MEETACGDAHESRLQGVIDWKEFSSISVLFEKLHKVFRLKYFTFIFSNIVNKSINNSHER